MNDGRAGFRIALQIPVIDPRLVLGAVRCQRAKRHVPGWQQAGVRGGGRRWQSGLSTLWAMSACYRSQKLVYFQIPLHLYATRTPKMAAGQQLDEWSSGECNGGTEMMGLEDTTVTEELGAEFDRLWAGSAPNPHDTKERLGNSLVKLKLLQCNFMRCTIPKRSSRYEKGPLCNPRGRNQRFTIGWNNLGPGTPSISYEVTIYSRRRSM